MADENRFDSRNIVEKYINHKLLKRGYVWKCQSSGEEDSHNKGIEDSSNSDRRLQAPSAGGGNNECLLPHRVTRSDTHLRLYRALREAGDEIEKMYQREFEEMSNQMVFTPNTAQRNFVAVAEELFRDGVNWGRIVAFFEFGGTMCVESVNREMASQVDNIARWMTDYLNGPLENWIEENGGWNAFMEMYGQQRDSVFHPLSYLTKVLGLAALGLAGVTIGAFFAQK
ncbi:apoptosis regulator Bcl-2-like isoform X1 [Myxocyprinus asiaticus]|uniref:apoptosis regulator Bcl-2-like isoform X1 n=1 Tax=Myxocyprinus asiaticus TaxID=70543 RepID=UPI0022221B6C|nr:apoptosis regulator Bcl-2-like isoform X1 [Myxocyprinus asiaticus]XP_051538573.1 apoptosis regulator Bcl-2-like isoform X1 [Myxocyprinus asiaticus]